MSLVFVEVDLNTKSVTAKLNFLVTIQAAQLTALVY